jgi:hypothetical protein
MRATLGPTGVATIDQLRERSGIETYSIGEGISRRVVVAPKRDEGTEVPRDDDEEYRQYS